MNAKLLAHYRFTIVGYGKSGSDRDRDETVRLVVGSTIFALLAFIVTHASWYDALQVDQKAAFWTDALVAYGTLALAVVTWASVRESQDLIEAEDLRFRQARMPMVSVVKTYREHGGVFVALRNNGDGPAKDVRVTFDAHTIMRWNKEGLADHRDQADETDVSVTRERCSSFMAVGEAGQCEWLFGAKTVPEFGMNAETSITFRKLVIEYRDVFGFRYQTIHDPHVGGEIVPFRFTWMPPPELTPKQVVGYVASAQAPPTVAGVGAVTYPETDTDSHR